jgi:hypothetical protein
VVWSRCAGAVLRADAVRLADAIMTRRVGVVWCDGAVLRADAVRRAGAIRCAGVVFDVLFACGATCLCGVVFACGAACWCDAACGDDRCAIPRNYFPVSPQECPHRFDPKMNIYTNLSENIYIKIIYI